MNPLSPSMPEEIRWQSWRTSRLPSRRGHQNMWARSGSAPNMLERERGKTKKGIISVFKTKDGEAVSGQTWHVGCSELERRRAAQDKVKMTRRKSYHRSRSPRKRNESCTGIIIIEESTQKRKMTKIRNELATWPNQYRKREKEQM